MVEETRVFSNNVTNCLLGYNEALVQEYGEKEGDTFPTMEDFLELHEGAEIYHLFVKEFVRKVVGEKTWKNNCYRILLGEYCSVSSEGFGLLILENNYDRWISKVENPDNDAPETRYTTLAVTSGGTVTSGARGSTRRFQGWSQEGYDRFKGIYNLVKADRAKKGRKKFEESLMESCKLDFAQKPKCKQASSVEDDGGEEYLPHEMDGVGSSANLYGKMGGDEDGEEIEENGGDEDGEESEENGGGEDGGHNDDSSSGGSSESEDE